MLIKESGVNEAISLIGVTIGVLSGLVWYGRREQKQSPKRAANP